MSSLLEQAIIDAKVLKETARKNAEAALLEQYKDIIKDNVQALLEQDEAGTLAPEAAAPAAPAPSDPSLASGIQAAPTPTQKKLMDRIPPAYLGEDNMQEIEINLDTLLEKVDALEAEVGPIMAGIDMDRPAHEHGNPTRIARDGLAENLEEDVFTIDESLIEEGGEDAGSAAKVQAAAARQRGQEEIAKGAKLDAEAERKSATEKASASMTPGGKAAAKMSDLQEELEEEGLDLEGLEENLEEELEEELHIDLADSDELGSSHGGLGGMNHGQLKKQHDADKAIHMQKIAMLEGELEKLKLALHETKNKLKKSTKTNITLGENVKKIANRFNDMSLLNARLLYTNKALTNTSLNERQKNVIAEAISKAGSVDQAKTIYEALQRSAGTATTRSIPQSLNEAINRSPSPFLPRANKSIDPAADRMRILAGIKK